ncbi:hypothetical protein Tco_0716727 [Tanacetum coccineum]
MSTSTTHQQSLANVGSETRPLMLERGSYIPWVSHFRRHLNRKKENIKWLNKAIDEGPYVFKDFTPSDSQTPRLQIEDDLTGDDLKHYEAEIEAMNLILISIPNDIYIYVDACKTAQAMWQRVERLMQGTVQNKVDRETHFNNEFDQFVTEPGEALVSYVTNVRLAKILTEDTCDDLFNYLHQYEKLVNASRAKKLEKSRDPLALVAHTGSTTNVQRYNCSENGHYARNYPKPKVQDSKFFMEQMLLAKQDEAGVTLTDEQNDFLVAGVTRMEEIEELSATICLMARIQPANIDSGAGPSYDSAFLSKVQQPSTSYVNPLFADDNQEQKYLKQPKIINDTIGDDQIDSILYLMNQM